MSEVHERRPGERPTERTVDESSEHEADHADTDHRKYAAVVEEMSVVVERHEERKDGNDRPHAEPVQEATGRRGVEIGPDRERERGGATDEQERHALAVGAEVEHHLVG